MLKLNCSLVAATVLLSSAVCQAGETALDYTMGPQDKLKVRVYDWRIGTYDTHEWPALTGEFTVGAAGRVAFPIVGELNAEGKTTAELASAIATGLRDKVGLAQIPFAAVEIIKYRPFYVLGAVAKPGEYPFRPGLTVLQAVGVGGGLERSSEALIASLERDTTTNRGDIRALEAERRQLLARQARIQAELAEANIVSWPAELADQAGDASWAQTMRGEEALLISHRRALQSQEGSADQTKDLLDQQLDSLGAKGNVLKLQEELAKTELSMVAGLVARGLAGTPRQIALQQNQAQLKGNRIDLELATVRTRQDLVKSARDLSDFKTKARVQLLTEESEVRLRVATINEKIATLQNLINQAAKRAPTLIASLDGERLVTTYSVARELDGQIVYVAVPENYSLRPGETLRVEQRRDDSKYLQSSNR